MLTISWQYRQCSGVQSFSTLSQLVDRVLDLLDTCPTATIVRAI